MYMINKFMNKFADKRLDLAAILIDYNRKQNKIKVGKKKNLQLKQVKRLVFKKVNAACFNSQVRSILLIIIILLDNVCLGVFEILPFGTYVYNYYKLMIFISKSEFHVSMMQKFIVKADPDVLGEFFLTMLARFMIRIMHKSCMILKRLNLPVSQQDFNLSQEIMEFLEEYHPRIVRTQTNLNNTSFLDQSMIESQTDAEREQQKKEEKRQRMLEKQKREKMIEEEIQKQQEELLKIKQQKLQEIKNQFDNSDQSDNEQLIEDKKNFQKDKIKSANSREQSKEKQKSPLKIVDSKITQIKKPIQQDSNKNLSQQDEKTNLNTLIKNKQQKEEQLEDQVDEDDILNKIDFNDSSSKQEDTSSNEKVYATQDLKEKQNKNLSDYLVEDEYEVLQQEEQQQINFKDGDIVKKKEVRGIKKSSSTQKGLPPTNYKSPLEQNSKIKVTSVSGNSQNEATQLTQSVLVNGNKKDSQESELKSYISNSQKLNQDKAVPSYKSKYANNPALYATLSQTRSHLDETKTKFELYKQKYASNTKLSQNISLIDKDD
ncbi:transmembrane protein, putative (macronuclear) [Tetrahymena thermophila SB210]|uniref:Transmembrane protein, putative n=1 Tax=Tetrahymena thermophila (strain SB210) TaxID=312017 RepID=I7MDU5_TETTS|nr:transmembrane protein, putative [Tetrahymena thermophila SB210]EAR90972.2 transmembrane protein, putative [Tetrahymena thermophila SB210]|eukprot:XP_001011217.2 transmembrane protein, putative [Tetrahymena thermophila SB210]